MFGQTRLPAKEPVADAPINKFHTFIAGSAGGVSSAVALTPFSRISTIQQTTRQTTFNLAGPGKGTLLFFFHRFVKHMLAHQFFAPKERLRGVFQ
jgi:hypothetical protein